MQIVESHFQDFQIKQWRNDAWVRFWNWLLAQNYKYNLDRMIQKNVTKRKIKDKKQQSMHAKKTNNLGYNIKHACVNSIGWHIYNANKKIDNDRKSQKKKEERL